MAKVHARTARECVGGSPGVAHGGERAFGGAYLIGDPPRASKEVVGEWRDKY